MDVDICYNNNMESIKSQGAAESKIDNQWDILNSDENNKEFFSEAASAERIDQYLDSVSSDEFMAIIRGYRKHLDDFRQRFSEEQFKDKYDNNPDLLNVYAFSSLMKDYLSKKLEITGIDLEIRRKDYNNTEGGHINLKEGKVYINFNYHKCGTLGDVTKTMAHEMWHAKQALSSFEYNEDGITVAKTPYYDALFKNYQEVGSDGYFDQAVEREAREFADAFERKTFSDNPSYDSWIQERYGFTSEYYGRLATDKYFDSLDDWYDEY